MGAEAGDFKIIRRYADPVQAEVDRAILGAHGIEASVLRDNAGGMLPSLQDVRLAVRWEDAVQALAILEQGPGADEPGENRAAG